MFSLQKVHHYIFGIIVVTMAIIHLSSSAALSRMNRPEEPSLIECESEEDFSGNDCMKKNIANLQIYRTFMESVGKWEITNQADAKQWNQLNAELKHNEEAKLKFMEALVYISEGQEGDQDHFIKTMTT